MVGITQQIAGIRRAAASPNLPLAVFTPLASGHGPFTLFPRKFTENMRRARSTSSNQINHVSIGTAKSRHLMLVESLSTTSLERGTQSDPSSIVQRAIYPQLMRFASLVPVPSSKLWSKDFNQGSHPASVHFISFYLG
ncbi:hypothetical protein DL546_008106 [Coniochaeta pulveracea]|uniref:Uncharacterized protein n=1 Tax=Coniochaeta pulveracea TaxID=177199 RepID=A0A420YI19_9PEZI|nr:hypothetical protein DL546_008106 [Coniochaeta pulveracea]